MDTREARRLLLQAQNFRSQLRRRQSDKEFERHGGIIIYAIDNDVLTTVTAPWNTQHQAYLRQLVASDEEAQESLAYVLSEYLFRYRQPSRPLPFVIVSPGDAELEGIWNRVYLDAQKEDVSLEEGLQRVVSLAKTFKGHSAEMLYALVRQLLECLQHRKGAIAQLHRIVRLQDSSSILPAKRVLLNNLPLFPEPNEEDRGVLRALESDWLELLNRSRPPKGGSKRNAHGAAKDAGWVSSPRTNNNIDAAVLAQIEWINRQFIADESGFGRQKLCFLTGDRHIERLAQLRGIADEYIRDPSCFLADEEFFQTAGVPTPDFLAPTQLPRSEPPAAPAQSGNSLTDWLDLILRDLGAAELPPDFVEWNRISKQVMRASEEWAKYLKSSAAGAGFREADVEFQGKVEQLTSTLLSVDDVLEFGHILAKLCQQAHAKGNEAMTRFGVSGVMASFLTLSPEKKWPSRIIPAVKMDSWPRAAHTITELLNAGTLHAAQSSLVEHRIRDLRAEDSTGYTVFIVYALAFAFAGEWESALKVSKAALSISTNYAENETSSSVVRGVEAAYLCAVFSRYLAKEPESLDACKGWIITARERQAAMNHVSNDTRFDVEELAIRVTALLFAAYVGGENDLRGQLMEFWPIRELCGRHQTLLERALGDSAPEVANVLCQQLATNFLQLQLLAKLQGANQELLPEGAKSMLSVLQGAGDLGPPRSAARSPRRPAAALTSFTFISASALFDQSAAGWDTVSNREPLFTALKDFGKKLDVMPYDAKRVERIIGLVEQSL
jgi:hypothetical protein